jgi:hypothetical protein
MDSRDIFAEPGQAPGAEQVRGSPQSGTLLSFPSVTDSARSANWEDGAAMPENAGATRGRAVKKYPRTGGDDDREESVSLWQRSGRDSPDDGTSSNPASASSESASVRGGIRLVQPRF